MDNLMEEPKQDRRSVFSVSARGTQGGSLPPQLLGSSGLWRVPTSRDPAGNYNPNRGDLGQNQA